MEQPIIEHGKRPRQTRQQLFKFVLAKFPQLGPDESIFFPETDRNEQRKLYYALKGFIGRQNLAAEIKFHDDGLRVWKAQ